MKRTNAAHASGHDHGHDHPHGHSHGLPEGVSLTSRRGLLALALAGGILPSPSALIVMLGAIQAHRVGYGIGLILAFSVGLALALIVVSLGALRAREAMANRLSSFWGRLVPVLSASAIVGVGHVPRGPGRDPDLGAGSARDPVRQLAVCQTATRGVSGVDPAGSTEIRTRSYRLGSNSSGTTVSPGSGVKSVAQVAWEPESSHTR